MPSSDEHAAGRDDVPAAPPARILPYASPRPTPRRELSPALSAAGACGMLANAASLLSLLKRGSAISLVPLLTALVGLILTEVGARRSRVRPGVRLLWATRILNALGVALNVFLLTL